jgi:hypothetical protein
MNRLVGSPAADLYSELRAWCLWGRNPVLSISHLRVIPVLVGLALVAPAAAQASRPASVTRVCAHQVARAGADRAGTSLRQLGAACHSFRFAVKAAHTSYTEQIRRDSDTAASAAAAKQTAEEELGTQYEAEIAPAVAALNNAYAAAASALVNSLISANATLCGGPVSAIPLLSKLLCSTYNDALAAAQAAFRSATAPANTSYAQQWAAIQSKYHSVNRSVATDRRRAGRDLTVAMARATARFRHAAGV